MKNAFIRIFSIAVAAGAALTFAGCTQYVAIDELEATAEATTEAETVAEEPAEWKYDLGTLYINDSSVMVDYTDEKGAMSARPWDAYRTYITKIVIADGVDKIGAYAFAQFPCLAGVNVPDTVASIGRSAFYNCTQLASVEIPASVTLIDQWAFEFCESLETVTIDGAASDTVNVAVIDGTAAALETAAEDALVIGYHAIPTTTEVIYTVEEPVYAETSAEETAADEITVTVPGEAPEAPEAETADTSAETTAETMTVEIGGYTFTIDANEDITSLLGELDLPIEF